MRFEEFVLQMWYLHKEEAMLYGELPKTLDDYTTFYYDWLKQEFTKANGIMPHEHILSS